MKSSSVHSLAIRSCASPAPTDRAGFREDRAPIEYAPLAATEVSFALSLGNLEPRLEEFVMSINLFTIDLFRIDLITMGTNLKTAF